MGLINVSINVDSQEWLNFLLQSKKANISASQRIRGFIHKEIKKGEDINV